MRKEFSVQSGKRVEPVIQHGSLTHPETSEVISKHTAIKGPQHDAWEQESDSRVKSPHPVNNIHTAANMQPPPKAMNNEKNANNFQTQLARKEGDARDSSGHGESQRYNTTDANDATSDQDLT